MPTMTRLFYHPDRTKLVEILDENKVFNLQTEFKRESDVSLSQSLLIWKDQGSWMLTDLRSETTYRIPSQEGQVDDEPGTYVYQYSDNLPGNDPKRIRAHLQKSEDTEKKRGTHEGVIDLLKMLNVDDVDVAALKCSDLSSEFDFERVHRDLSTVHAMLREIPASPRERLLSLPREHVEIFSSNLQEFYEKTQAIKDFGINRGKDSRKAHANLLHEISDFCDRAKAALGLTITHLKALQVDELENQVNATVAEAVQNSNAEVDRINAEAEAKEAERQQEFANLKLRMQNQLAETSVSHHKKIFEEQADKHYKSAQRWLGATIGFSFVFGFIFWLLLQDLEPAGSDLSLVLQNLFTKGFFLSLIYLLLHRCIKNYTAEKHLETVNRHRQNALDTFDAFVDAAEGDRETRDAVLLAATNCIFDANQSGYLSAKTSRSESTSPIQHVVKTIPFGKSPPSGE